MRLGKIHASAGAKSAIQELSTPEQLGEKVSAECALASHWPLPVFTAIRQESQGWL
jgi:hypothetical protein